MSEKHQFVDNPLLLTDLFSKGVYYFGEGAGEVHAVTQPVDGELISEKRGRNIIRNQPK